MLASSQIVPAFIARILKLNGIAHEYAWLDRHPDDYVGVITAIVNGNVVVL